MRGADERATSSGRVVLKVVLISIVLGLVLAMWITGAPLSVPASFGGERG